MDTITQAHVSEKLNLKSSKNYFTNLSYETSTDNCVYAPLAYLTHLTDSCAFSKFVCIEGGGYCFCVKVFADFEVLVGYFKITNHSWLF